MALIDMWREDRDGIRNKSLYQILAFAGEGRLADNNACSAEFRELLGVVPLDIMQKYASEALTSDISDSGLALQDIVNELGCRLGYDVEHGLYRGRRGESGHDGLWMDTSIGHSIIAEVKSTSAYRIKLEPLAHYRELLIGAGRITKEKSSILIIVGKADEETSDLEAQIRGSRYAWDIRVISLAALFKLVELKSATDDPSSARLLRGILIPREYTKLDSLLDIVSFVAQDISAEADEEVPKDEKAADKEGAYVSKLNRNELRAQAKQFLVTKLGLDFKDFSRTLLESHDGRVAICYAPSQPYRKANYTGFWFGLHQHQIEFMAKHPEGYVAYLCTGAGILFAPWSEFSQYVELMLDSSAGNRHWRHVILQLGKDGKLKMRLKADAPENPVEVSKWFVKF